MALPFVNSIAKTMPGWGSPSNYGAATQTLTATGGATITIGATATTPSTNGTPFNINGGPAPSGGKLHFRTTNMTTTATVAPVFQVSDGTNTWNVGQVAANAAGPGYLDYELDFQTDIAITSVVALVTVGGTATSVPIDFEVSMT
jgi:hypothetical protein